MDDVFFDSKSKYPRDDRRRGINDKEDRYINFFTVGPMEEDAKRVTGKTMLNKYSTTCIWPIILKGSFIIAESKYNKHMRP